MSLEHFEVMFVDTVFYGHYDYRHDVYFINYFLNNIYSFKSIEATELNFAQLILQAILFHFIVL